MNFFKIDLKKAALILFVVLLPFLSMNLQREPGSAPWYLKPVTTVFSIFDHAYFEFSNSVRETTLLYLHLVDIKKKNEQLNQQNSGLQAQLTLLAEMQAENKRLNDMLELQSSTPMKLLAARVIGQDLLSDHTTIRINRGSQDNVSRNMPVISVQGAVGYVLRADIASSVVLVLTDRYAVIDGVVQRSRARVIVEGMGNFRCRLNYVQSSDDIQIDDLVVTSGLDGIFPKGFPVASVLEVSKKPYDISKHVTLKPVIQVSSLEEVFVIKDSAQYEFTHPELTKSAAVMNLNPTDSGSTASEIAITSHQ